jgi:hypothetical protein
MINATKSIALALRANFNDDSFVLAFRTAYNESRVDALTLSKIFNVTNTDILNWTKGLDLPRQSDRPNILGVMLECIGEASTGSVKPILCKLN